MAAPRYSKPASDPRQKLRELQTDTDISPEIAELRLAVLRLEIPDALVQIDAVRADDTAIAVKVTIGLPGGARHSAIAAADVDEHMSWAEQLEMAQAIAICRALDGLDSRPDSESAAQPRRTQQPVSSAPTTPVEADHLPEYSWNAFWQTMNQRNITREQVEQALGKTVQEATPKEAVDALRAAGLVS